jgi:hypothetical protein
VMVMVVFSETAFHHDFVEVSAGTQLIDPAGVRETNSAPPSVPEERVPYPKRI